MYQPFTLMLAALAVLSEYLSPGRQDVHLSKQAYRAEAAALEAEAEDAEVEAGPLQTMDSIECHLDRDCPPYFFCSSGGGGQGRLSVPPMRRCVTNYRQRSGDQTTNCRGLTPQGTSFPNHTICQEWEAARHPHRDPLESTMRCFPLLDYTCAKANFAPCTPNHDLNGNVIPNLENSCPYWFWCKPRQSDLARSNRGGPGSVLVCLPKRPKRGRLGRPCRNGLDCGYDRALQKWTKCDGNCIWAQ